jgi:hypothetical protein
MPTHKEIAAALWILKFPYGGGKRRGALFRFAALVPQPV